MVQRAREHRIWRLIEVAAARRLIAGVDAANRDSEEVRGLAIHFH